MWSTTLETRTVTAEAPTAADLCAKIDAISASALGQITALQAALAEALAENGMLKVQLYLLQPRAPHEHDPRDPDPTKEGIFRDHSCWKCDDGAKPCPFGPSHLCEYPHVRND